MKQKKPYPSMSVLFAQERETTRARKWGGGGEWSVNYRATFSNNDEN